MDNVAALLGDFIGGVEKTTDLVGDNLGVVRMIQNPPSPRAALMHLKKSKFAGLWRAAFTRQGWLSIRGNAHHVNSHLIDKESKLLTFGKIATRKQIKVTSSRCCNTWATFLA